MSEKCKVKASISTACQATREAEGGKTAMKKASEIYVDNKVRTVIKCTLCGSTMLAKAGIDPEHQRMQLSAPVELGLTKYPYVYGVLSNRQQS